MFLANAPGKTPNGQIYLTHDTIMHDLGVIYEKIYVLYNFSQPESGARLDVNTYNFAPPV